MFVFLQPLVRFQGGFPKLMGSFQNFQGPGWYQLNPPPKMAKQQPSPWIDSLLRGTRILLNFFFWFVHILKEPTVFFLFGGGSSENDMVVDLGQGDKDGMMPLHWAADRGDLEMVPSPKSTWLLVVGVFRATFFVVIFSWSWKCWEECNICVTQGACKSSSCWFRVFPGGFLSCSLLSGWVNYG